MIILDSNIVSELQKINCDQKVRNWVDLQNSSQVRMCSIVCAELKAGAEIFYQRVGSKKYLKLLEAFMHNFDASDIIPFDFNAANEYGNLKATSDARGKTKPKLDLMIAAICHAKGATLATRNVKDFEGLDVKLINPFEA